MIKNLTFAWFVISFLALLTGIVWKNIVPGNGDAIQLYFYGWISTLLAIGYFSTPSNSIFGKVAFGGVIMIVAGIVIKVLHLAGANECIILGLLVIGATYATMWQRKK